MREEKGHKAFINSCVQLIAKSRLAECLQKIEHRYNAMFYELDEAQKSDLLTYKGFVLYLQDRYDEAEDCLTEALARCKDNSLAHAKLGSLHFYQKRYPEAIKHYIDNIKSGDFEDVIIFNLAYSYFKNGEYKKALHYAEQYTHNSPDDEDGYKFLRKLREKNLESPIQS